MHDRAARDMATSFERTDPVNGPQRACDVDQCRCEDETHRIDEILAHVGMVAATEAVSRLRIAYIPGITPVGFSPFASFLARSLSCCSISSRRIMVTKSPAGNLRPETATAGISPPSCREIRAIRFEFAASFTEIALSDVQSPAYATYPPATAAASSSSDRYFDNPRVPSRRSRSPECAAPSRGTAAFRERP